jgi:hypothetical protein
VYRNKETARRVREELDAAKHNGEIASADLVRIVAGILDDVVVPENFDLVVELAKDLGHLHPAKRKAKK